MRRRDSGAWRAQLVCEVAVLLLLTAAGVLLRAKGHAYYESVKPLPGEGMAELSARLHLGPVLRYEG